MALPNGYSLRPAGLEDVDLWCRLMSTDPRLALDPVVARDSWNRVPPGVLRERSIVQEGGIPIGILRLWRPPGRDGGPQFVDVGSGFLEGEGGPELRDAVWDHLEARAREVGADVITSQCLDHEAELLAYLERRGYGLEGAGIFSELRIGEQRERFLALAAESQARLHAAGVELTTLDRLSGAHRALHEVLLEAEADIPSTVPVVSAGYDQFLETLRKPWIGEGRVWVAVAAGRPVGISYLGYYPTTGSVFTNLTGVARAYRGRGIARGLKLQTIVQALEMGVTALLTHNDAENAPILKINRDFGYQPVRRQLLFRKPA